MGQINSRSQNQSPGHAPSSNSTTSSSVAGVSTELQPDSPVDVGAETSNRSQSQRSSVRKNILKLVTPSNIRGRINSIKSNPGNVKRSWRNSRRWSRAQPDPAPQHEDSPLGSSSGSSASTAGPSTLPSCHPDKGKQREITPPSEEDEEYPTSLHDSEFTPPPAEHLSTSPSTLNLQDFDSMIQESAHPEDPSNPPNHEVYAVPLEGVTESPSEQRQQPIPTQPQQQRPPSLPRQFPPPGTLVVVQGIVHTTDVSRPSTSTTFDPATSGNTPTPQSGSGLDVSSDQATRHTRNRLSALLRPRSLSRPVSTIINNTPAAPNTHPEGDSPSVSGSESLTASDESAHTAITTPNINELGDLSPEPVSSVGDQPLLTVENRSTSISSSSIDVLGTLLSVAAAATAASLLTGSSEPILSSGLAPPQAGSPHMPHQAPNASMPNLPSYTSPALPGAVLPDVSAAGRSERMRQAWGTIRERLGLRPSPSPIEDIRNQPHQDSNTLDAVYNPLTGDGLGSPTDTRELMLAEMARAFNIGLGLNGLGGLTSGSNSATGRTDREVVDGNNTSDEDSHSPSEDPEDPSHSQSQSAAEVPNAALPPEGSFERFLVDLQIDLRAALTQSDEQHNSEEPPASTQEPSLPESQPLQSSDEVGRATNSPVPLPWTPSGASHDSNDLQSNPTEQNNATMRSDTADTLFYRDGDYVNMPFLQDVTDSESEFDEDEHENDDYEEDDFQSAEHGSLHDQGRAEPSNVQHGHTPGTGRIDASGRINWWRLYRFPPIVSPHSEASDVRQRFVPSSPASASTNPSHAPTALGQSEPSQPLAQSETIPLPFPVTTPRRSSARETPSHPPSQSVVPVIVVGLQSVNSEWRADIPPQGGNEDVDSFGQPTSDMGVGVENAEDDDLDGWGGQHHTGVGIGGHGLDGSAGRGRARGWHSRAANAIRNLRPGRRNVEVGLDTRVPTATPGSRTFLIYVIGGYYPPDHSIVTGGPNILDSFEALLELADLLGQVKPPTVSKDEIEKSGLEIIKASDLPQHEQAGKVSSNCLDRCLICLDDYEPEDPIRVMSCRHAFHQNCVDEWLQKGRNNCPACRSTGVTTDNHSTVPIPNSAL